MKETHILHAYNGDLYGQQLKVCICGYLRPEQNFDSLQSLIAAIENDITQAKARLELPDYQELKNSQFFINCENNNCNGVAH